MPKFGTEMGKLKDIKRLEYFSQGMREQLLIVKQEQYIPQNFTPIITDRTNSVETVIYIIVLSILIITDNITIIKIPAQ